MEKILVTLNEFITEKNEDLFSQKIGELEKEIKLVISTIKNVKNIQFADIHFELLEKVQYQLARLLFKEEKDLPATLKKFVKDFDRIDDVDLRKHIFEKIKDGSYSLSDK